MRPGIFAARERGEPTVPTTLASEKAFNPFLRAGECCRVCRTSGGQGQLQRLATAGFGQQGADDAATRTGGRLTLARGRRRRAGRPGYRSPKRAPSTMVMLRRPIQADRARRRAGDADHGVGRHDQGLDAQGLRLVAVRLISTSRPRAWLSMTLRRAIRSNSLHGPERRRSQALAGAGIGGRRAAGRSRTYRRSCRRPG